MAAPTNAANLKKALANDAPELTTAAKQSLWLHKSKLVLTHLREPALQSN